MITKFQETQVRDNWSSTLGNNGAFRCEKSMFRFYESANQFSFLAYRVISELKNGFTRQGLRLSAKSTRV